MGHLADENFRENLSWEGKARRNPLFAVMSVEEFNNVAPNEWTEKDLERFFAKGQFMYDVFFRPVIQRLKLNRKKAFIVEYGSGMGRILKAVCAAGFKCAGIDISPTMLEHSRRLVPDVSQLACIDEKGNCDIPSNSADFVYSYAVIQHIDRLSRVRKALSEMCRILKPGGYLKIQIRSMPSELPFRKPRRAAKVLIRNFESKSLLLSSRGFKCIDHNNWLGVPLSLNNMQKSLHQCDVAITGIEQDVGRKIGNMMWVLGRKY